MINLSSNRPTHPVVTAQPAPWMAEVSPGDTVVAVRLRPVRLALLVVGVLPLP